MSAADRQASADRASSTLAPEDLFLFNEGSHFRLFDKLGAHAAPQGGTHFAVWAPNARAVSVIGDFNGWAPGRHALAPVQSSGIWAGWVDAARAGDRYKYRLVQSDGAVAEKADPVGFLHEQPPGNASIVHDLSYEWGDAEWMATRARRQALDAPVSIYEVHLGGWARDPLRAEGLPRYLEIAPRLAEHCRRLNFTHVELMPVTEHPFYGSWGYQCTGYFAPTSRYGTPQELMGLVDHLHQRGIGVVLDWVPSHFPIDAHGLARFDGTHLYEHADPRQGFHPDWKSAIFNYGRHEVRAFLISSALFWLEKFHVDALRVDGVASMLYLDYGRAEGEWVPNRFGGRENLDAVEFLRRLNTEVYRVFPDVQTIAEESTAWPQVSRPVSVGGLGFGYKWDMGWMHDTLRYFARDPVHRRHHHGDLTFRGVYMFSENYVLPLSHDEVVHLKRSLLEKMPGDPWQQFANLRLLLAHQWTSPGKKLLFMGGEFAQRREWSADQALDWALTELPDHAGVMRLVADLNRLYRELPALHEGDCDPRGFAWIDADDAERSVLSFLRRAPASGGEAIVVLNCTPVVRRSHRIGAPRAARWRELLNTDAAIYGGSGVGNLGVVDGSPMPMHAFPASLTLTLPPLGALVLVPELHGGTEGHPEGASPS